MKIICFYLPQFHRVKENDEWWGDGFTEWTAVKEAESLFDGHNQPVKPFKNNYYNLLEKKTMQDQCELMHKYSVYGMCFYHYWFKDGRKILEKPAENLLKWKDINMPFCFSWANESWVRTWSNISEANSWSFKIESKQNKKGPAILLEQAFGDKKAWEEHFYYLLPFFRDKRYIKHNGKPVFMFYKPSKIDCLSKMVKVWRSLAEKEGLKGLYLIGKQENDFITKTNYLDAFYNHEPQIRIIDSIPYLKNGIECFSYDNLIAKNMIETKIPQKKQTYYGAFSGYDDTPRRGEKGTIVEGSTPEKFEMSLIQILKNSEKAGNDYLFINAWNEWGEGMYIEPDMEHRYAYLEAIKKAKQKYKRTNNIFFVDINNQIEQIKESINNLNKKINRHKSFWKILDCWLSYKQEGLDIVDYFIKHKIKTIGVYGIGMLGRHLIKDLEGSDIKVVFGIDKKIKSAFNKITIYSDKEKYPKVDAIIVTVVYEFESIKKIIRKNTKAKIICIDEIFEKGSLI